MGIALARPKRLGALIQPLASADSGPVKPSATALLALLLLLALALGALALAGSAAATAGSRPTSTATAQLARHAQRAHARRGGARGACASGARRRHRRATRCLKRKRRTARRAQARHTPRSVPTRTVAPVSSVTPEPAAILASVLATPCPDTELTPQAGDIEQVKQATLCLVNQERARNGELPLQLDNKLEAAAQAHSEDMVARDYFAHVSPDGETPLQRVQGAGYIPNEEVGYTIGENLAWGTSYLATPQAIVAAWIASPEHIANILDASYRDTGLGVVAAAPASLAQGQSGATYSQEFGVIVG